MFKCSARLYDSTTSSARQSVDYFTELHELGLFTHEEYLEAFRAAGLGSSTTPKA